MTFHRFLLPIFLAVLPSLTADVPNAPFRPVHQSLVNAWLMLHPGFRVATENDCVDCAEQVASIRRGMGGAWKPVPYYDPYRVVGDFNGDGINDLAIAVINPKETHNRFRLLIFNGPFTEGSTKAPNFVSDPMNLEGDGLFFGPPRPKPYKLLVGAFESEGRLLIPKGTTYRWR